MLAASSLSFISCRSKATTNGKEMSASAHFNTYRITRWQQQPLMPRCADGSNNKILCHMMATTTTSCASTWRHPLATTNHIVSRDGNDNHMCAARWQQHQNHGCDNNIVANTMATTYHIALISYCVMHRQQQSGCSNNICYPPAPRASTTCHVKVLTKNKLLRRTMATTYHLRCAMATTYNIASPNGDN